MPNSSLPRPLALFLIAACPGVDVPLADEPEQPEQPEDEPMPDPDPPEDVNEWTVAGRYVAIFDKTADDCCPEATDSSWSVEPLFRSGEAYALMGGAKLPAPLERFCRYTWHGEAPPAAVPVPTWNGKYRIDPDRDVLMPQTTYLGGDPATRDELAEEFRKYSGTLGSGAATQVYEQTGAAAQVAVIDSAGYADAALEYASAPLWHRHGLSMAELVHTVRCPNDEVGCRGPQFHAQAFPYVGTSLQAQAGGGPLGSIGSLAYALGEAVIRWQTFPPPVAPLKKAPLILNLSVAWDPADGDADLTVPDHTTLLELPLKTEVPANVQAVHAMLVYAGCLDALTIAASGNNTGAPCEQTGAMAPALWERYPTPDTDRCEALFGKTLPDRRTGDTAIEAAASSLVYAAGGVTAYGQPIPVARPDSTPPRVVLAFQAVVGAGARQTDAWTGTSVAAAALSGLAASIWTHHPDLTPSEVIGLITSSGEHTGLPVATSATGEARLITGHAAFENLCATRSDGAACTNPYLEAMPPEPTSPEIGASNMMSAALQCTATATTCGGAPVIIHGCAEAGAAPMNVPAPSPWLRPQPDIPYCPYCPVRGGKLTLSLNPDHGTGTTMLDNPTLEFRLADGSYVRTGLGQIPVDEDVDLGDYMITIDGDEQSIAAALLANNVTAATLGFYLGDGTNGSTRATSAVPVKWDAESSSPDSTGGSEWGTTSDSSEYDSTGSEWGTTSESSEYDSTGLEWGTTSDSSEYDSTGLEWGTTSDGSGDDSTGSGWGTTSDSSGWDGTGTENTTSTGTGG